jgi:hypothetical protein
MAVEGLRVGDVLRVAVSVTPRPDAGRQGADDRAADGRADAGRNSPSARDLADGDEAELQVPICWRASCPSKDADGFNESSLNMPLPKPPECPATRRCASARCRCSRRRPLPIGKKSRRTMAPLYKTDGAIAPGSPLAAEVAKIAAASSDPRTRAALALRLVQEQVRYLFRGHGWRQLRAADAGADLVAALWRLQGQDAAAARDPACEWRSRPSRRWSTASLGDHVPNRVAGARRVRPCDRARHDRRARALWLDGTGGGSRLADLNDVPTLPQRAAASCAAPRWRRCRCGPMRGRTPRWTSRWTAARASASRRRSRCAPSFAASAMMLRCTPPRWARRGRAEMADGTVGQYVAGAQVIASAR